MGLVLFVGVSVLMCVTNKTTHSAPIILLIFVGKEYNQPNNQIIFSSFYLFYSKTNKNSPWGLVILFQHNSFIFVGWSKRIPCIVTPLGFDPCSLVESDRSPLTNRYSIICVCCDKNDRMEIVIWGPVANSGRGSSDDGDIFCVFCR